LLNKYTTVITQKDDQVFELVLDISDFVFQSLCK
jgi:hypothetical protein